MVSWPDLNLPPLNLWNFPKQEKDIKMKWYEFTQDNGDGSFSKLRFKTKEEAEVALDWLENNHSYWQGDGDGVYEVDTDSNWFFDSLEGLKGLYDV